MKTKLLFIFYVGICMQISAQFATENIITDDLPWVDQIVPADIDGDGDIDIVASKSDIANTGNRIVWYENLDGLGNFGPELIVAINTSYVNSIEIADLNGDNRLDIIACFLTGQKIVWYENTDGLGTYGAEQIIDTVLEKPRFSIPADIDGDGDIDLIVGSETMNRVDWIENLDGLATFGPLRVITPHTLTPIDAAVIDLEGDGDLDVITLSRDDRKIAWFQNTDGVGNFSVVPNLITTEAVDDNLMVANINGDTDLDILTSAYGEGRISWYENENNLGDFAARINLTWTERFIHDIDAADLDGDGDVDVVSAAGGDDIIGWFRNLNGSGIFGSRIAVSISLNEPTSVRVTDINGDGKPDIVSNSRTDGKIVWFESSEVLSVNNEFQNQLSIYPIPSSDIINIRSNSIISSIDVYDFQGKLVLNSKDQNSINISHLSNGIYMMRIQDNGGNFGIKKVIKN